MNLLPLPIARSSGEKSKVLLEPLTDLLIVSEPSEYSVLSDGTLHSRSWADRVVTILEIAIPRLTRYVAFIQ